MKIIRNFKSWILICFFSILISLLGGGVYLFKENIFNGFNEKQREDSHIEKELLIKGINTIKADTNKKLKKISQSIRNSSDLVEDSKNDVIAILKKNYHALMADEKHIELYYFDNKQERHNISSSGIMPESNQDSIARQKNLFINMTDGKSFIDCQEICKLFVVRPLLPNNFDLGFLQAEIPVDHILDQISYVLHDTNLIILRARNAGDKSINYDKQAFDYETSTSHDFFERLIGSFKDDINFSLASHKKNFLVSNNNSAYFIEAIDENIENGLLYLLVKDVFFSMKKIEQELRELIIFSLVAIILSLILFYLLLLYSMRRIKNLSKVLHHVANNEFHIAKRNIENSKRISVYDEIDLIYNSAYTLTNELETALTTLEEKNNQLEINIEKTKYLAEHDTLTDCINRHGFKIFLDKAIADNQPFALICLDLNKFKLINDSLGHAEGDRVLIEFSAILHRVIDSIGVVGRMGGDEFSIIIYGNDSSLIQACLLKIAKDTKTISFSDNLGFQVSTSIGVALFPDDAANESELSMKADAALYENKRFKLDIYHFYNGKETMLEEEKTAQHFYELIENNLSNDLLTAYFQPIYHKGGETIFAYEILARMFKDGKVFFPRDFISFSEKNRSIIKIDLKIFKISLLRQSQFKKPPILFINLSYATILSDNFIEIIIDYTKQQNCPPKNIVFEIIETTEIKDMMMVKSVIKRLKKRAFALL